ncbi:Chaperone protein dnaJ 49 [Linum perenne]
MDGNKDDAMKCLRIGKEALASGDRARAAKFFSKARRLDPSLAIEDLIADIEKEKESSSSSSYQTSGKANGAASNESKLRHRANGTTAASASAAAGGVDGSSSSSSPKYTEDQVKMVRQINKKKDYYEILGVDKSCTVDDVRKAYRKLSLKVHPDKNQAPGAEEAFKSVSKAFQCLSNEESRNKYDVTGSEEPVIERRAPRRHGGGMYNGLYDEFDADEIFRQFFYGGMSPAATQFRTFNFGGGMGVPRTGDNGSGFNARALIQLLPVLLIVLFSFLPASDPIYSLSRSYPYEHRYTTEKGVNFYVKSGNRFEQDYPIGSQNRIAMEGKVERDYVSLLSQNCRFELQRQQWGFVRETPHCDMLQQYQSGATAA